MNKIAILFAILAVASAAVQTNTPSSAFAIAPGKVFANTTDTAFTGLTGPCYFNGGFDNTTNYVWCQTVNPTATIAYTFQRRAINASSPATVNSTMDTKLTSTQMAEATSAKVCSGPGYFGLAADAVASNVYNLYLSYAAVNATGFTKVALTANTATGLYAVPQTCLYDNGIFYVIYKTYVMANNSLNSIYVQAVNVTSGAVYYNSTGGVKLFDFTSQAYGTITSFSVARNNKTGSATSGLILYSDTSAVTSAIGYKYNLLPFTLATGAAGSLQTLATGATATASATGMTFSKTTTSYPSASTGTTTMTSTTYAPQLGASSAEVTLTGTTTSIVTLSTVIVPTDTTAYSTSYATTSYPTSTTITFSSTTGTTTITTGTVGSVLYSTSTTFLYGATTTGTLSSTLTTAYTLSAFGALSTYGVVLVQDVATSSVQLSDNDVSHAYTVQFFFNGSSSASTNNFSSPSGYHLGSVAGFSTSDGYAFVESMISNTGGSNAYYLDQYFYNGTNKVTATSLGTFASTPQSFPDATGSIWIGYGVNDPSLSLPLSAGYAGEALYISGASILSTIFAALAVMIAALFAF